MFWSYIINGIMGLVWLIPFVLSIISIQDALNDPSGFAMFYVLSQSLPVVGINVFTAIGTTLILGGNISINTSTARQTFAFARDKGLPFHRWIGHISERRKIPVNAVIASCIISIAINLLNLGSSTAFGAIISLNLCSLMLTYTISISCLLYRRLKYPPGIPGCLPPGRWTLGKWGPAVNVVAIAYSAFAFFWSFWPPQTQVDGESMNYSVAIFGGVVILALAMYQWKGKYEYRGPVMEVEGFLGDHIGDVRHGHDD
jgi:amino acid transporter